MQRPDLAARPPRWLLLLGVASAGLAGCPERPVAPDGPPPGWTDTIPVCDDFVAWDDSTWGCSWGWTDEQLCEDFGIPNPGLVPQEGDLCPAMTAWLADPLEGWLDPPPSGLADLTPLEPVDSLELYRSDAFVVVNAFVEGVGVPCSTASDMDACLQARDDLVLTGFGNLLQDDGGDGHKLVYTRGDAVGAIPDREALDAFLAPLAPSNTVFALAAGGPHSFRNSSLFTRDIAIGFELVIRTNQGSRWRRSDRLALRFDDSGSCVFAAAVNYVTCDQWY